MDLDWIPIIIGVVCGVAATVVLVVVIALLVRRRRRNDYIMIPTDLRDPSEKISEKLNRYHFAYY